MVQLLALEWDQFEARLVIARQRAGEVLIQHAFAVSLAPRDAGQTFADVRVGERLKAALSARGVHRPETIVAVGRSGIELRRLSLPPAPEEELPEMVRLAAVPQFSNLGEDWPLDFFVIDTPGGNGREVLAAAISPQLVEQIVSTAEAADLKPQRLVLRPCAAASLLVARGGQSPYRVRVLVDLLAEEADLTVLVDNGIVLMRTVRLPVGEHSPGQSHALVAELRRTIASAQNQLGGQRVQQVVICGNREAYQSLGDEVGKQLSLPIDYFDPFAGFEQASELKAHPPEHPGRFAPLVGMILEAAQQRRHAIDFLNPRKRPQPQSRRRVYALAAAAVAALLFALGLELWWEKASLNHHISKLNEESAALDELVEAADARKKEAALVDQWKCSDVTWLDELQTLSSKERFPTAEDARLTNWRVAARPAGGGDMLLEGFVSDAAVITRMEEMIRGGNWRVRSGANLYDNQDASYPWRFEETVVVAPPADSVCAQDNDSAGRGPATGTKTGTSRRAAGGGRR